MARRAPLRNTISVSNLVQTSKDFEEMFKVSSPAYDAVAKSGYGRNLVKYTKDRLGKQNRTFTGEFRYYLWEYPNYTIWVANGKGFEVTVIDTLTPVEAMAAYKEAFSLLDS